VSLHVSVHVDRPAGDVYAYLADRLSACVAAAGLSGSIEQRDGRWYAESPMGEVEVRFVLDNPFGVLDHDVTLPNGTTVTNPMWVIPDDDGCEVVFTLRPRQGMSDDELDADADAVRADLARLKELLEG